MSARRFLLLLLVGFVMPLAAFGQVDVSPTEIYPLPAEPTCTTLTVQWGEYQQVILNVDTPSGTTEWPTDLDWSGQASLCAEYLEPGDYTIRGVYYPSWGSYPAYAYFYVHPAPPPPPPPVITVAGYGCPNWDCIWASGVRFRPDSRLIVYSLDWTVSEMYYGSAWQMNPPLNINAEGDWLAIDLLDPTLKQRFGWDGVRIQVINTDGSSNFYVVHAPQPTVTTFGPGCTHKYCLWISGTFPLNATVGFRIRGGDGQVLPNSYSGAGVSEDLITLLLDPSVRYAYDTAGLDMWIVNTSLANWSSGTQLPVVDRRVLGRVSDTFPDGNNQILRGWACAKTQPYSINVHVYTGGPAGGGGTLRFIGTANAPSDPAVTGTCDTTEANYQNYEYYLAIPASVTQYYGGEPIYVYGISPIGLENRLLDNWGTITVPFIDRSVIGTIESITQQGQTDYVNGWACARTYANSIGVHVYVGQPGSGTMVLAGTADQPSDPGIAAQCNAGGQNYRFSLPIPQSVREQYGGQPFYAHGISPYDLPNELLGNAGAFTVPIIDRSVIGWLSGVSIQGTDAYVFGWACAKTHAASIDVHVYAGGPAGSGTFILSGTANQASEPAIATECGTTGANYRYSLLIPLQVRQQFAGQRLHVHGISPFGLPNNLLNQANNVFVPGENTTSHREYIYLGGRVIAIESGP
jgi:hypothetical protein